MPNYALDFARGYGLMTDIATQAENRRIAAEERQTERDYLTKRRGWEEADRARVLEEMEQNKKLREAKTQMNVALFDSIMSKIPPEAQSNPSVANKIGHITNPSVAAGIDVYGGAIKEQLDSGRLPTGDLVTKYSNIAYYPELKDRASNQGLNNLFVARTDPYPAGGGAMISFAAERPDGSTYLAPMTANASQDPQDPVMSLSPEAMMQSFVQSYAGAKDVIRQAIELGDTSWLDQYNAVRAQMQKDLMELRKKKAGGKEKLSEFELFKKFPKEYAKFKKLSKTERAKTSFEQYLENPEEYKKFKAIEKTSAKKEATPPTATDIDDYVADDALARQGDPEAAARNAARLAMKRAQAGETAAVSTAKETGKKGGERNMEQYDSAVAAKDNLYEVDRLINHLETSDAKTGLGAEMLKDIERVKAFMGSKVAAGKVTDTEILDSLMGKEVFPLIKSLGIGARGLDTPAEREFLRSVMTGTITLNKNTLLEMASIRKNIAKRAINKWNARVNKGELDKFFEYTGITKEPIEYETPSAAPAGAAPSAEQHPLLPPGIKYLGAE